MKQFGRYNRLLGTIKWVLRDLRISRFVTSRNEEFVTKLKIVVLLVHKLVVDHGIRLAHILYFDRGFVYENGAHKIWKLLTIESKQICLVIEQGMLDYVNTDANVLNAIISAKSWAYKYDLKLKLC